MTQFDLFQNAERSRCDNPDGAASSMGTVTMIAHHGSHGPRPICKSGGNYAEPMQRPARPAYDPWIAIYARGKDVLGRSAGGQITLLRKLFDDKPSKVMAKIEDAAEHRNPTTWLAAFLWSCKDPDGRLSGETIPGGWSADE